MQVQPHLSDISDSEQLGETDHPDITRDLCTEPQPTEDFKKSVALSVLKIRELHRIPISVMDEVMTENQLIFSLAIEAIRSKVSQELSVAGVSHDVSSSVLKHLSESSPLSQLYRGLETEHLRSVYLRENLSLVVSLTLCVHNAMYVTSIHCTGSC